MKRKMLNKYGLKVEVHTEGYYIKDKINLKVHKCLDSSRLKFIRSFSNMNSYKEEINEFKNVLLPRNIQNSEKMKKVKPLLKVEKNRDRNKVKDMRENYLKKGFLGYEKVLKIESYNSHNNELLLNECKELINQLEQGKFYSLLINASTYENNFLSVLPYSIYLYNKASPVLLANIIKQNILIFEAKYEQPLDYTLEFLLREWYTKDEIEDMIIENREKKIGESESVIKDESVSGLIKHDKISISEEVDYFIEDLSYILDEDLKNKEGMLFNDREPKKLWNNKIKNLKRKSVQFRINPYIIENKLPVINGDFTYSLYSLESFKFMFVKEELLRNDKSENVGCYSLLELYHGDSVDYTIFYKEITSSGEVQSEAVKLLQWRWTDYFSKDKKYVTRCFGDNKVVFKYASQYGIINDSSQEIKKRRNIVDSAELAFNFPTIREQARSKEYDDKLGVIDLETFKINEKDGTQCAYAGGWAVSGYNYIEYLSSEDLKKESDSVVDKESVDNNTVEIEREDFIKDEKEKKLTIKSYYLIKNLIDSILKSKFAGCVGSKSKKSYTFFAHNLSNFDFILILSALSFFGTEFDLKTVFRRDTNTLVSLKITKLIKEIETIKVRNEDGDLLYTKNIVVVKKKYITLLDSNLIIPGKLRKLVKDFDCVESKGYFPYDFVNINTLFYKGDVPSYNYFKDDISKQEYINVFKLNEMSESIKVPKISKKKIIYNLKLESIKYLKSDLFSLLELLEKYSKIIYNNFGLNITERSTAASLSLFTYLSNFYKKKDMDIKLIKGAVEKDIRCAYFGGIVFSRKGYKFKGKGYIYDVNSHFPAAMLNPMPTGNPILSNSKDLQSYFGFVYAHIIPPKKLDVYFIPKRNQEGRIETPNVAFTGIYFSELLKEAEKYGYRINVIWGYKFKKSEGVFNHFVNTLFNKRLEAKIYNKKSLQIVYKLMLNSLYGRFGMRNYDNELVIVDEKKAMVLFKSKNVIFQSKLHDKFILKYNNNVNKEIINLVNKYDNNNTLIDAVKQVGVTSNVSIAAAITGWALIKLSRVLNIKDNKLIYSDTDSAFLEKKLDDSLISETEIGKFKLENVMDEGIFISPKFYGFKNEKGDVIIKSKGVPKDKISYDDLEDLYNGKDKTVRSTVFRKNLKKGTISILESNYIIKGVNKICKDVVD